MSWWKHQPLPSLWMLLDLGLLTLGVWGSEEEERAWGGHGGSGLGF